MNIKRLLLLVTCMLLLVFQGFAQNTFNLGYCPDELTEESGSTVLNVSYDCLFSAAIIIPESRMKMLKGSTIRKIRLATEEGLTLIKVMLCKQLDDSCIDGTYTDLPGTTTYGWKEVELNMPYTITGEQLIVMYTGYLPAGQGLLYDGKPNKNACWTKSNGIDWIDRSQLGCGALCLQAVVETNEPIATEDYALSTATPEKTLWQKGETATLTFGISNYGSSEAKAPAVHYCWTANGADGETQTAHTEGNIAPDQTAYFKLNLSTTHCHEGYNELKLWIDSDNGITVNDTLRTQITCYEKSFPRKTLIEQFSTMNCSNCPSAHRFLDNMLKERTDYVWIVHHTGFGTDELTIPDSEQLGQLLNVTAAPRLTYDRRILPCSLDKNNPIIPGTNLYDSQPSFDYCTQQPAFTKLDIEPHYNEETDRLEIMVRGERTNLCAELFPHARLTVQLIENNVETQSIQAGSYEKIQNHVYRQSLTSIIGDEIVWNGNVFSHTLISDLPATWNPENLTVAAFINQPTENETTQIEILNANKVHILTGPTGTGNNATANSPVIHREYYNLQGIRIDQPDKGIYLEKRITPQGESVLKHLR